MAVVSVVSLEYLERSVLPLFCAVLCSVGCCPMLGGSWPCGAVSARSAGVWVCWCCRSVVLGGRWWSVGVHSLVLHFRGGGCCQLANIETKIITTSSPPRQLGVTHNTSVLCNILVILLLYYIILCMRSYAVVCGRIICCVTIKKR